MGNIWSLAAVTFGASHLALTRVPRVWLTLAATGLLLGGRLAPSTTAVAAWLLFFVAILPEVVLMHVGGYGVRGIAAAAAYWGCTALFSRWDPDLKAGETSSIRRSRFWQHLADYFPSKLIAEGSYDDGLHLFVIHPHGLWGCSTWANLIPIRAGIRLPKRRVCTLDMNFKIPLLRDLLFSVGMIGSSSRSIRKTLKAGINVMLVVGGGKEALYTKPGTLDLVLNRRRGYVKLALESGASLVPILNFGETAAYGEAGGAWLWSPINRLLLRTLGMSLPIVQGHWGTFLPRPVPQHTVIGPAIPLAKEPNPSTDLIEEVHAKYCSALRALYDRHKDNFDKHRSSEMRFVE